MNRRQFLGTAAGAVALLAGRKRLQAFNQSPGLKMFAQPLRGIDVIPVAAADAVKAPVTGVLHYTIDIRQFQDTLHPSLGPTTLWGYNPATPLLNTPVQRHLGGIIVANKGVPVQITFRNHLPGQHPIPVDITIPGANQAVNRTAVHLHGGLVPWISDGGPFDWWTPSGQHGDSFLNNALLNPGAAKNQAEYFYPNNQSARLVWYHDHAFGITRINAYAGVASGYIIRDTAEAGLIPQGLPNYLEAGGNEIPIVIQDKIFVDASSIDYFDPDWKMTGAPSTTGSLWYPHVYDYKKWEWGPHPLHSTPPSPASVIPEMFGDTMLANGSVYPDVAVQPRRYRLRVLNACNARFLNLQTYVDDSSADGITLAVNGNPTNKPGPDFLVIGNEAGFLETPVAVNAQQPFNPVNLSGALITAPAERWDIIIDFSAFGNQKIILYNDAPAPFPGGDPANDYYFGAPGCPTHPGPGFGPNTRQILRFTVAQVATPPADLPLKITGSTKMPGIDAFLVKPGAAVAAGKLTLPTVTLQGKPVKTVRNLTLNEDFDEYGRLIQMLGTGTKQSNGSFAQPYTNPSTENPKNGDVEIWQIANLTADTHPMHFHLVNVQVLGRQPFDAVSYAGGNAYNYLGNARDPAPEELGWKETVKMNPGEVTTVMMQFTLPGNPPNVTIPLSKRPGLGVQGHEYVWHCHILEHEEHDMMRPLVVTL